MGLIHRKKLFVDPQVQGALMWRAVFYWLVCVGLMTAMLACWQAFSGPGDENLAQVIGGLWMNYGPALVVSLLVLPLVLFDVVRISNRFVGPVYRLRQHMRQVARGEHVGPIKFRQGDFWLELAEEFNEILVRVEQEAKAPLSRGGPETERELTKDRPTTVAIRAAK